MADSTDDLVADYSQAGFGGGLPLGTRPALAVIDMVRAYFEPTAGLYLGDTSCLQQAATVLHAARSAGIPVFHTRVQYDDAGIMGGLFIKKVRALEAFRGDAPLGAIMPEVEPIAGEPVIAKNYASAFFGTSLHAALVASGVDTLVIVGVSTSGCIRATAVDAMQNGLVPVVVRQAVGDRHPAPHEANLFDLEAKYANVMDVDEVTAWLRDKA